VIVVSSRVYDLVKEIELQHPDWPEIDVLIEAYRRDAPERKKESDLFWGKAAIRECGCPENRKPASAD